MIQLSSISRISSVTHFGGPRALTNFSGVPILSFAGRSKGDFDGLVAVDGTGGFAVSKVIVDGSRAAESGRSDRYGVSTTAGPFPVVSSNPPKPAEDCTLDISLSLTPSRASASVIICMVLPMGRVRNPRTKRDVCPGSSPLICASLYCVIPCSSSTAFRVPENENSRSCLAIAVVSNAECWLAIMRPLSNSPCAQVQKFGTKVIRSISLNAISSRCGQHDSTTNPRHDPEARGLYRWKEFPVRTLNGTIIMQLPANGPLVNVN